MSRKKISTTVYVTPEQDAQLKALSSSTKVPIAEFIRQGIDLVLEQRRKDLPLDHIDVFDAFRVAR